MLAQILSGFKDTLFFADLHTSKHGWLQFSVDYRNGQAIGIGFEEVQLIKIRKMPGGVWFDTWAIYHAEKPGLDQPALARDDRLAFDLQKITLDVDLLKLEWVSVSARASFIPLFDNERVFGFNLDPRMKVRKVEYNGTPVEFFQNEDLSEKRANEEGTSIVYIILPELIPKGKEVAVKFDCEGNIIEKLLNVYYVGARAGWYPNNGHLDRTLYEITYRMSEKLDLVSVGEKVKEWKEGQYSYARYETKQPVFIVGFNFGAYKSLITKSSGGVPVAMYANKGTRAATLSQSISTDSATVFLSVAMTE